MKTCEPVAFFVRGQPPELEKIFVTGTRIILAGSNDFAVHPKPEGWPGFAWRVSHIETGAMVAGGDSMEAAIESASGLAKNNPNFKEDLKRAVTRARKRIAGFEFRKTGKTKRERKSNGNKD